MAIIGNSTVGTVLIPLTVNQARGCSFTIPANHFVSWCEVYLTSTNPSNQVSQQVKVGMWREIDGVPLGVASAIQVFEGDMTPGWYRFNFSPIIAPTTTDALILFAIHSGPRTADFLNAVHTTDPSRFFTSGGNYPIDTTINPFQGQGGAINNKLMSMRVEAVPVLNTNTALSPSAFTASAASNVVTLNASLPADNRRQGYTVIRRYAPASNAGDPLEGNYLLIADVNEATPATAKNVALQDTVPRSGSYYYDIYAKPVVEAAANQPPVADFTFSPNPPVAGEVTTLTSTSTDPDGTITEYAWDLNQDGVYDVTGQQTTRTFLTANTQYQISHRVTDNTGATTTVTKQITTVAGGTTPPPTTGITLQNVVTGLDTVWAIQFAPNGHLFFTERAGRVNVWDGSTKSVVLTLSGTESLSAEEGLQGFALDPNFASNNFFYVYYSYDSGGIKNRVVRYTYNPSTKTAGSPLTLIDAIPGYQYHVGGRIKFGPDGKLYVATGDATDNNQPGSIVAQDNTSLAGKILRINSDGTIPAGNPIAGNRLWSKGHRNPQGLCWHPTTGDLWATEHGPTSGAGPDANDEVNRIIKGGNYGWPYVYGVNIDNPNFTTPVGFTSTSPVAASGDTVWAPGGCTFYTGDKYGTTWNNALIFTGLGIEGRSSGGFTDGRALYRLPISSSNTAGTLVREFHNQLGRIRDVIQGPDGFLYICTSNRDGRGPGTALNASDDRIIRLFAGSTEPPPPVLAVPQAPTGLVVTPGDSQLSLTWSARPAGEQVDVYQVYVNDVTYKLDVTGTSYTITGLTNGTSYSIRVGAHNATGYGPWGAAISATPVGATTPPPVGSGFPYPNSPLRRTSSGVATDANSTSLTNTVIGAARNANSGRGPSLFVGTKLYVSSSTDPLWTFRGSQGSYQMRAPATIGSQGGVDPTIDVVENFSPYRAVRVYTPSFDYNNKICSGSNIAWDTNGDGAPEGGKGTAWNRMSAEGLFTTFDIDGCNHRIKVALGNNMLKQAYRAPARAYEVQSYGSAIEMGTTFVLTASRSSVMTSIDNLGLTGNTKKLAVAFWNCMIDYGVVMGDGTGAGGFNLYINYPDLGLSQDNAWKAIRINQWWNPTLWKALIAG